MIKTGCVGVCFSNQLKYEVPLAITDLSQSFRNGYTERGVTIQHSNTYMVFGNLTVEVPRNEPLAKQFYTMHLRIDVAPAVTVFHGFVFLRDAMTAWALRSTIASRHSRVS